MNKHHQEVRIVKSVRLQDHPGKTWSDFIFMVNYSMLLVDEEPFHYLIKNLARAPHSLESRYHYSLPANWN